MENTIDNTNLATVISRGGALPVTNFDLYVDVATGSDTNDGSVTSPFATLNTALLWARVLGKGPTNIHLADGTYPETIKTPSFTNTEFDLVNSYGNNTVYITGNTTTPSNVKIIGSGSNTSVFTITSNKTQFIFDGMQVEHSGTGTFRTGFSVSDSVVILKNVDFANIDRGITLTNNARLLTDRTGNQRNWSFTGASASVSGVAMATNSLWSDLANIEMTGLTGYGIVIGTYSLYTRSGDTLLAIASNQLRVIGDVTNGCAGGIYVASEGTARLVRVTYVRDARNEQSKSLRAAAIVLDKGGKLELTSTNSILAEDCNAIIATSPQSLIRETGTYSSYIALGSTPSIVSVSPGTQMAINRVGNPTLPQFSNVTVGFGTAVYNTNPDTIVIASLLAFSSVTGGPLVVGETVTGGTSGATGTIESVSATSILYKMTNGNSFVIGETVTGGTSLATFVTTSAAEYNLLTKSNIQAGDTLSFTYDQATYTNAFNTFTVASVDRSMITLDIADTPTAQGYGPGSNVYTVGKVVAEQATKESTVSFASDFDPYVVEEFGHVGALPLATTAYFNRSGALSSSIDPIHIPHVSEEIWDLQVQARVAPGAGQTDTYTVMVNGAATAAAVTLSGATQTYNGVKLDTPISITCGQINTIYEVGGGGVLTDLLNRGFFTGTVKSSFSITSAAGAPDTFSWTEINSVTGAAITNGGPTAMTGGWQLLADGVYIRFTNTTGHSATTWNFACTPADVVSLRAVTGAATASEGVNVALGIIRKQSL